MVLQVIEADDLQVVDIGKVVGDVGCEGIVAAFVVGDPGAVDIYHGGLIGGADVQQHPAPVEALRQGETAAVMQGCGLREVDLKAGQTAFRAEGDPDVVAIAVHIQFPGAVEVQVRIPAHLGPGVYSPGRFSAVEQFFTPGGQKIDGHKWLLSSFGLSFCIPVW